MVTVMRVPRKGSEYRGVFRREHTAVYCFCDVGLILVKG